VKDREGALGRQTDVESGFKANTRVLRLQVGCVSQFLQPAKWLHVVVYFDFPTVTGAAEAMAGYG
jgi:hypothetical protein